MDRRDFLRRAAVIGGATALGGRALGAWADPSTGAVGKSLADSVLNLPAGASPVDHIVVLMMENRSFDHFLGWLATDDTFLETGLSRYGSGFRVDGNTAYSDSFDEAEYGGSGEVVSTRHWATVQEENPYRGCGHPDPGHGWTHGRVQRDHGFLADGSRNDPFALGYYEGEDVPVYAQLARQFTSFDHYHCSILGPTFPNREYMHSASSGGLKTNKLPPEVAGHQLGFQWDTIWDRLLAAGVSVGYYCVDLPAIGLWGPRLFPLIRHIGQFHEDCEAGTLPRVVFVDPGFTTGFRTDDHPYADIRSGQRFVYNTFKAFKESVHWASGAFFVNYDEWGGFFDTVAPPKLADDTTANFTPEKLNDPLDDDDFGQAGFRTPCLVASPYARPGYVDHGLYDHTSILRFIEWRYLGAPAAGTAGSGWWLTARDRNANNIGAALSATPTGADVDTSKLPELPVASLPCSGHELEGTFQPVEGIPHLPGPHAHPKPPVDGAGEMHAFEKALHQGAFDRLGAPVFLDWTDRSLLGD